jgi:hypothetical protein
MIYGRVQAASNFELPAALFDFDGDRQNILNHRLMKRERTKCHPSKEAQSV